MLKPTHRCAITASLLLAASLFSACRSQPETVTVAVTRVVVETVVKTVPVAVEVEVAVEAEATPTPVVPVVISPKDLVICTPNEPATLYPFGNVGLAEEAVLHAIYENDFTNLSYGYQPQGIERIPSLANGDAVIEDVEVKEGDLVLDANGEVIVLKPGAAVITSAGEETEFDGAPLEMPRMTVAFSLKPRVWADGAPVTAADSVYSFKLDANPDTPTSKFKTERTAGYEATGELTLRWKGLPGFLDTTYFTNLWRPLPRHLWQELGAAELVSAPESSHMPLGDGPFKIVEWVIGDRIRLEANEMYYRASQGLPYLDSVTYRFIPDAAERMNQLLSGRCDIATQDGLDLGQVPLLFEAQANGILVPYFQTGTVFELIDFGIDSWGRYGDGIGRPDWFEDVRVRQAMVMCTDRQRVVDDLLYGRSRVLHSYVPDDHPLYPGDLPQWPHDVQAAGELLDEAGFVDTDGDGTREDPATGREFRVALTLSSSYSTNLALAQIFREGQRDCGIDVELRLLPASEWYAGGSNSPLFGRRFDLGQHAWPTSNQPPCFLFSSWQITGPGGEKNRKTGQPFGGWGAANATGWWDPEFDEACLAAMKSLPGTAAYETNHKAAQRVFAENVPVIPLFMRLKVATARPDVLNFGLDPTQRSELWNLFEIDLRK